MLKLLTPEENKFQILKCGEVFCLPPSSYHVTCCLCKEKIHFGKFPEHFQTQHLETTTTAATPKLNETSLEAPSTSELDPIKSEEDEAADVKNLSLEIQSLGALDEALDVKPFDFVELQLEPEVTMIENIDEDGGPSDDADKDWDLDKSSDSDESDADSSSAKKSSGPFKCTDCTRGYKSRRSLSNHRRIYHHIITRIKNDPNAKKKDKWPCEKCSRCYKSRRSLANHLRAGCSGSSARKKRRSVVASTTDVPTEPSTDDAPIEPSKDDAPIEASAAVADVPDDKFWDFDKLSDSDESDVAVDIFKAKPKPGMATFKCTDCGRSYKSRRTLTTHRRVKHHIVKRIKADPNAKNKDNWPCETCPRSYKSQRALWGHLHTGCGGTAARQNRKSDATTEPSADDAPIDTSADIADGTEHKCTECDEVFRCETYLRTHMLKHTGIVCDICGKSFKQMGDLKRHQIRHTGIKAHKCTECDYSFFTIRELNAHMIRHTQIFPHICEVCGKKCRDGGVLKSHMRRHTGERPAECKVCGKRFFCGFDLNVHSVTHTTERPFKCDICGATFQLKKSLRVHKKLHSTERNHECKVCGKTFAQSSGLVAHMRSHDATQVHGTLPGSVEAGGTAFGVVAFASMSDMFR